MGALWNNSVLMLFHRKKSEYYSVIASCVQTDTCENITFAQLRLRAENLGKSVLTFVTKQTGP